MNSTNSTRAKINSVSCHLTPTLLTRWREVSSVRVVFVHYTKLFQAWYRGETVTCLFSMDFICTCTPICLIQCTGLHRLHCCHKLNSTLMLYWNWAFVCVVCSISSVYAYQLHQVVITIVIISIIHIVVALVVLIVCVCTSAHHFWGRHQ